MSSTKRGYACAAGCVGLMTGIVALPFYWCIQAKWFKVFGVTGGLGFLVFWFATFVLPLTVAGLAMLCSAYLSHRLPRTALVLVAVLSTVLATYIVALVASIRPLNGWRFVILTSTLAFIAGLTVNWLRPSQFRRQD